MDEIPNPNSSGAPLKPVHENKIKKTLKLFKDSWKSFSKTQKFQLIAVFALILGLPTLLGGVYAAKLYRSGAATPPVTPPYSPTPIPSLTPAPTASPTPKVSPTPITLPACIKAMQPVSLSPNSQSGYAGTPLLYKISVKNNDGVGCLKTGFTLSTLVDTDWIAGLSNTILTLDPGMTGTAQVIFTSSKTAKPGSYPVSVGASNSSATIYANSAYVVLATPTPTPPPNLSCGAICRTNSACSGELICYQPPMPPCPPGRLCPQVMPAAVCRNPSCPTSSNCLCATSTPTPKIICKTGVNTFSVSTSCTGGFRYTSFVCYDGYSQRAGGPTSCKSSATWSSYAASICAGRSNCKPTPTAMPVPTAIPAPTPTPACRFSLFGICLF